VQERRKYGALGWNIPYSFNNTDLDISKTQLEMFLDQYDFVPYKVLNFLTSYINYGGRVTDYIDIRTIDVILKTFYNPEAVKDDHYFTPDGIYRTIAADPDKPHKDYMEYIEGLPLNAGPAVFGMHSNANIAAAMSETFEIFGTIALLESTGGGGGGGDDSDALVAHVAGEISDHCPPLFILEEISMQYPIMYEESMNTVLGQECIRYNKLLQEMRTTLPELLKALQGLVVMSNELEAMSTAMQMNVVPDNWAAKAYPSLKPLSSWVQELWERVAFITNWIDNGIPVVFWVTGYYFPQAFFTGSLQNFARKYKLPIDSVQFNFLLMDVPKDEITKPPEDGVYITGLYLEGARWNPEIKSLDDSRPKQLYTQLPIIHLDPEQNRKDPEGGIYRCPVYKELSRKGILSTTGHSTNFIMFIEIPSNKPDFINSSSQVDQSDWVLAGVAAFCSLKF
jgi:dynein heavy chain